ncbi:MAG TPA: hypothetical protein VFV87_03720 [Pirellulaceae bacterium]|nr:hypothetical protein [Pirellulaceae bacterium]
MKIALADWFWLVAYVALVAAVAGLMFRARGSMLAIYGTDAAQAEWDAWREDAREMASGSGPVKRREPKSAEPPALVLMRDYFAACLGLAVLLSSVLFGTFMVFLRGALRQRGPR